MQCMVIEFARDVLGLTEANSTEMEPNTPHNVIDLMEEQKSVTAKGGTMRLGAYDCVLVPGSRAAQAYGTTEVKERHRHRFEFNNDYRERFEEAGHEVCGREPRHSSCRGCRVARSPLVYRDTIPSGIFIHGTFTQSHIP